MLVRSQLVRFRFASGVIVAKNITRSPRPIVAATRSFSADNKNTEKKSSEDLKDTLNDIKKKYEEQAKQEGHNPDSIPSSQASSLSNLLLWMRDAKDVVVDNVRLAYQEMIGEEKESTLKRKLQQAETYKAPKPQGEEVEKESVEDSDKPLQPSAIVLVKEGKSAWDSMKERLQDSPLIREILKNSKQIGKAAAATDIGKQAQNLTQNVRDKVSDVREFWETSQNPLVYTLSGIWDNVTAETEEGLATASIRKLDPKFIKEEWAEDVRTVLAPKIIKAHLDGDLKTLKLWLGEAAFNKLAADIRVRKADGVTFDSNILNIDEIAIVMKLLDDDRATIVIVYFVQQINCVRKNGEIVEGSVNDIRGKYYSLAFQQNYDEDTQEISWQIMDYDVGGDSPYF